MADNHILERLQPTMDEQQGEGLGPPPKFRLNVNTYVLIIKLSHLDPQKKNIQRLGRDRVSLRCS